MNRHVIVSGRTAAIKPETIVSLLPTAVTIHPADRSAGARHRVQALASFIEAAVGCAVTIADGDEPTLADLHDAYALVTDRDALAQRARETSPLMHVIPLAEQEQNTLFIISTDAVFRPPITDPDVVEAWTLENSEIAYNRHAPGTFALGDWDIRLARMHGLFGTFWAVATGTEGEAADELITRLPHTSEHGTVRCQAWEPDDVANDIQHAASLIAERERKFDRIQIVMGPQAPGFVEQMMDRLAWLADVPVTCHVTSRLGIEERDVQALIKPDELPSPEPWAAHDTGGEPW